MDAQPSNAPTSISIYSVDHIYQIQLNTRLLSLSISDFIQHIKSVAGFSNRINLYRYPICSCNKLAHIPLPTPMSQLLQWHPDAAFTYNNTQYAEESEYNRPSVFCNPRTEDSTHIEMVMQICQQNCFLHEDYRFPGSYKMASLRDLCVRYGPATYIIYYNMSVWFDTFGRNQLLRECLSMFADHMGRVTIAAGDQPTNIRRHPLKALVEKQQIDSDLYIKIKIPHQEKKREGVYQQFVVDRRCKIGIIQKMLDIFYGNSVTFERTNQNPDLIEWFPKQQRQAIAVFDGQTSRRVIQLPKPLRNSILLNLTYRPTSKKLVDINVLQQCSILHRITVDIEKRAVRQQKIAGRLPSCVPTIAMDEDLVYIRNSQYLVAYSITIHMIKLKYFNLKGQLQYIRIFPWYTDLYGEINLHTFDLFCVQLKKPRQQFVRVFDIHAAEDYLELGPCTKFYSARLGQNCHSDGSGVFAITDITSCSIKVYSLYEQRGKQLVFSTKLQEQAFRTLTNVMLATKTYFEEQGLQQNCMCITLTLNFTSKLISVFRIILKKGCDPTSLLLRNVLCEAGTQNISLLQPHLLCCSYGTSFKTLDVNKHESSWSEKIQCPENSAILCIDPKSNQPPQVVSLLPSLQVNSLTHIFVYEL